MANKRFILTNHGKGTIGNGGAPVNEGDLIELGSGSGGGGNPDQVVLTDASVITWDLESSPITLLQSTSAVGATRTFPNSMIDSGKNGGEYTCTFVNDFAQRGITYETNYNVAGELNPNPYGRTIITIKVQDGEADVIQTAVFERPEEISSIAIQDEFSQTRFDITDNIKFEGVLFDDQSKKITVSPLTAYTIYVDTVNGDDSTGQRLNINRPYKTDQAAYDAIPNDGKLWRLHFIDGDVYRDMSADFPDKDYEIYCIDGGTFDFTNSGKTVTNDRLLIYAPESTIIHGAYQQTFGCSGFVTHLRIDCKKFVLNTKISSHGSTIIAQEHSNTGEDYQSARSWIKCDYFDYDVSHSGYGGIWSFYGDFIVNKEMRIIQGWNKMCGGGYVHQGRFISINKLYLEQSITTFLSSDDLPDEISLKRLSGNASYNLDLTSYQSRAMKLILDDLVIDSGMSLSLGSTRRSPLTVTGTVKNANGSYIGLGSNDSWGVEFVDFKGPLQPIPLYHKSYFRFRNCYINFADNFFAGNSYYATRADTTAPEVSLEGSITLISDAETPATLADTHVYHARTIELRSDVQTNCTGFGKNVTPDLQVASFKQKLNEIVIRDKSDIINKDLLSGVNYIIDGDLALNTGENIIVPEGGLTISGYSFDSSRIGSYGQEGHSIFVSPIDTTLIDQTGNFNYDPGRSKTVIFNAIGIGGRNAIALDGISSEFRPEIATQMGHLYPEGGGNPYSVGLFFNVDGKYRMDSLRMIMHQGYTSGNTTRTNFSIQVNADNKLYVLLGGVQNLIDDTFTFDTYHHIEVTWDGVDGVCYYDGQTIPISAGTNGTYGKQTYKSFVAIGAGNWYNVPSMSANPTKMLLSNLYFYNRARAGTEAVNTYNNGDGLTYEEEQDLTSLAAYYKLSEKPTGGSGNLVIHNCAFTTTGTGAKVFDIHDIDGNKALEMVTVNFEGCQEIGYIHGYRQGTGITIGFYGNQDGLRFSGVQNGFKLTNTNGFGNGSNMCMFREWGGLEFKNRFYLEINVDLPTGACITDFGDHNFREPNLLQINTTLAKVDGVIDKIANTPKLFPNITPYDRGALFTDNIGLQNSPLEPDEMTLEYLKTYPSDQAALDDNLPLGWAYIESASGVVKKLGTGSGAGSGGGGALTQIIEVDASRTLVDSDYGRILMISSPNVVLTIPTGGLRADFTTELDVLDDCSLIVQDDGGGVTLDFPWGKQLLKNRMGAIYRKPGLNEYRGKGEFSE